MKCNFKEKILKGIRWTGLVFLLIFFIVDLIKNLLLANASLSLNISLFYLLLIIIYICFSLLNSKLGSLIDSILLLIVGYFTNNPATTLFNVSFYVLGAFLLVEFIVDAIIFIKKGKKIEFTKHSIIGSGILIAYILSLSLTWGINFLVEDNLTSYSSTRFTVPKVFDTEESDKPGTLEEVTYETKAYATDNRVVKKNAMVYLPNGYDMKNEYNILYLLHGTGDSYTIWLKDHKENKIMVDNLIEEKIIKPLIIVTPTFYVEKDCLNELDKLTYSFENELKNDLIPFIETKYSTYASDITKESLINSRSHRAFAGLSRGAVTMYRSVLGSSLDYFSNFGAFSGSRINFELFNEKLSKTDKEVDLLFISSGVLDFALANQLDDYNKLLKDYGSLFNEDNTTFELYPMRYHSMGNWHLSLYNFLGHLFKYN